ncbi:proline--tRNA ligase [Patescibacteria group bacterium]|nr:proline--tRNA ligase [Patescibacteria group bacterium]
MRQSKLFGKTIKEAAKDEISLNARLLNRGGFVEKLMSGVYSYLPLGLRVLDKIKNIVREEMNATGAMEVLMPTLQPKELWDETGRWEGMKDVMFQFKGRGDSDIGLGCTHEEVITDLVRKRIFSYKELPVSLYQIQDKFRNEPRAKSGLLRGREFWMKDMYSFHTTESDFEKYYDEVKLSYLQLFKRCGLDAKIVEASGGIFTEKFSHEFQVFCETGEDTIHYCRECDFAQNIEICEENVGDKCPKCGGEVFESKGIEVGNIFPLETKYSGAMNACFTDKNGERKPMIMGCYGLGPSRIMGTIVEVSHDDKGIIWPKEVAPFAVHLVALGNDEKVFSSADQLYDKLVSAGMEVLYDDREESAGIKLGDSDLLGIPMRIVISNRTLEKNSAEIKMRAEENAELVELDKLLETIKE